MLDADARDYLKVRRTQLSGAGSALTPQFLRDQERQLRARYGHGPVMFRESEAPASDVVPRHIILDPSDDVAGVLVYFHGGGWVMGDPEDYLAICRVLAIASGWRVVVADYRKAPEHPFPAAFNDAVALSRQLSSSHRALHPNRPFAIGGDSAGGNLAAAATAALQATDPAAVDAQVLITPVLDCDLETPSYLDEQRQLTLTRDLMAWFWDQYAPPETRVHPHASPLRSDVLTPPVTTVFISVGSDVLKSEGDRFLARVRAAGGTVAHREYEGQLHGFFQLHGVMSASVDAAEWIARQLGRIAPSALSMKGTHE